MNTKHSLQKILASYFFTEEVYDKLRVYKTIISKKLKVKTDEIFKITNSILRNGDLDIDIGANIGQSTIYFSESVGANGKVLSIEPVKRNFNVLLYMINKMKLNNVVPINNAVSDVEGLEKILIPLLNKDLEVGTQAVLEKNKITHFDNYHYELVNTITIDGLGHNYDYSKLRLIKCDTEGAEIRILNGGMNTILKYKPIITLEIDVTNPNLKIIYDHKYKPFYLFNGKLVSAFKVNLRQDPIFIHEAQIAKMNYKISTCSNLNYSERI